MGPTTLTRAAERDPAGADNPAGASTDVDVGDCDGIGTQAGFGAYPLSGSRTPRSGMTGMVSWRCGAENICVRSVIGRIGHDSAVRATRNSPAFEECEPAHE
jgi:hypothetical protein